MAAPGEQEAVGCPQKCACMLRPRMGRDLPILQIAEGPTYHVGELKQLLVLQGTAGATGTSVGSRKFRMKSTDGPPRSSR